MDPTSKILRTVLPGIIINPLKTNYYNSVVFDLTDDEIY